MHPQAIRERAHHLRDGCRQGRGHDIAGIHEVLKIRAFRPAVDADWELSAELQISAVPTFILNQSRLVGAYTYEEFVRLMESNGVKRRLAA